MLPDSAPLTPPAFEKHSVSTVYVDFHPVRATHTTVTGPVAADIDIRGYTTSARHALLNGPPVPIVVNGYHISTIPLSLLQATSTRIPELLNSDGIYLAPDTDIPGLTTLIQHLLTVAYNADEPHEFEHRLQNNMSVRDSLAVCQAAHRMGMIKYTAHVFRKMEAYLSNSIPQYHEIDAVLHFAAAHPRLRQAMVRKLALAIRDEAMPDPETFAAYCVHHPKLNAAITQSLAWCAAETDRAHLAAKRAHWQQQQEKRQHWQVRRDLECAKRAQEQAHLNSMEAERQKHDNERRAQASQRQAARAAHEVAMRQSCVAKTRASGRDRAMTVEEKKWYVKEFGKQPPRGC